MQKNRCLLWIGWWKWIRVNLKKVESDSNKGDNDNDDEENEEKEKKVKEIPQDLNDIKIKTNNLFMQRNQRPWEYYEELGVGNYGVTKKVHLIKNPEVIRAKKIIPEENVVQGEGASLIEEIEILKNLERPNIMQIYESFVYNNNYYIVLELCDQGHL